MQLQSFTAAFWCCFGHVCWLVSISGLGDVLCLAIATPSGDQDQGDAIWAAS